MKILFIHNKYIKFSGEEAVVESQIRLLKRNGHQIVTYFRSSEELEFMTNDKMKAFFLALYNPKSVKEIKELLEQEKPDIVHVHNLYPLISPAILPIIKKMGVPIVMTVHNYRLMCPNGLFFSHGKICEKCTGKNRELNCIVNNCEGSIMKSTGYAFRNYWSRKNNYFKNNIDIFLCLTLFQKKKLLENEFSNERCRVLSNFYDKEIKELDYKIEDRNYVAFAGRISPEKGIHILVEAARRLPQISFHLAGNARDDYLDKIDLPKNVILKGMLNKEELSTFYLNARIFVLPSIWYEGFPMVFPEAMAHKLPIIAPKLAGFSEIVEHNINGLLFEPGDAVSLAITIKKLWNSPRLSQEMAENNFQKVKSVYSSIQYLNNLENTYKQLLKV